MARLYFRIGPTFWTDHAWGDDERLVALYLLTSPHRTSEGIFRMPLQYAATDVGWPAKRFHRAFDQLIADGFVEYDPEASVCLIVNALKWQKPDNPNQRKAACKAFDALPATPLRDRFLTLARTLCPTLAEALTEGFTEPIPHPPALTPTPSPEDPPSPPQAGGAAAFPDPPVKNRRTDQIAHETACREFVAEHFPGVTLGLVRHWASQLRLAGHEPTVELIRLQLEQHNGGVAAA